MLYTQQLTKALHLELLDLIVKRSTCCLPRYSTKASFMGTLGVASIYVATIGQAVRPKHCLIALFLGLGSTLEYFDL